VRNWWILGLALAAIGCSPLRTEAEFHDECDKSRRVAEARAISEARGVAEMRHCQWMAAFTANRPIERRNREIAAMATAIILGAGSDALAQHNFYVYRVPEARRYLRH
jgi:hypothetical protein